MAASRSGAGHKLSSKERDATAPTTGVVDHAAHRFNESIPFLMHSIVANGLVVAMQEFAELGMNVAEARVLLGVLQYPGIRVGQLSEMTCIAQSTLSHLLRRLSHRSWIRRQRVDGDNRSVTVELTAVGQDKALACQRLNALQEAEILHGLPEARADALRELLLEIYARMGPTVMQGEAVVPTLTSERRLKEGAK